MSYQRHLIANEIALLSANEMSYQRHLIANENTPVSIVIGTHTLRVFYIYMFGKSDH